MDKPGGEQSKWAFFSRSQKHQEEPRLDELAVNLLEEIKKSEGLVSKFAGVNPNNQKALEIIQSLSKLLESAINQVPPVNIKNSKDGMFKETLESNDNANKDVNSLKN